MTQIPKTPLIEGTAHPLWVLQVVVRILGELLEKMITDASFASIAEHAALKALLRSGGLAAFGKDETALISEREEDMNKQISLSHHLNVGKKPIIFVRWTFECSCNRRLTPKQSPKIHVWYMLTSIV